MIVKNGEILAIDHIAHDNTLSGNGTSAKPVGLSQSTKDLIDSKVKKTDFETYKSSAANQISNINTKITVDESNFESYKSSAANQINTINNKIAADEADFNSYKSSAHNEIARIDGSIAAVNAAKVDKTTFTQYQTDVANNFTAVNKRIDDVDAAKQDKGNYVSASDFNSYKSSAHNEIVRVDEKIDTTSDNLRDNYYKTSETYNRTEVDEKFANFGGFKFRDPDPTKNNEPKLAPEEVIDPKAIYLTQPAGATQYLQWIWNTEVTPNVWKCIGDTTMDLSDYAKTVDVVQSANNNVQTVKDWADNKFETKQEFESVIAGYYTKSEVNTELATKVNNTDFNAYKTEVAGKFTNTSAWANETFATKQNLTDTKAELEDTIESVSGEIISKVNTDYGTLDGKIDAIANTLSNDYYTSLEIDAILAASGEYYTKSESDTKYTEKTVFNTAINELNSNKLDKSATANWDVTEYTEGENIKIVGHEISGKDWSNEIAAAVENKVDESELENYYTSSQIDGNFVTKTEFNKLDNEVGAIDADLDILSGKTVTVIKDSETVKAIRSTEPDGTISYTLSAHDGKQVDYLWKPTVNAAGDISWELALTGDIPDPANIKGPQGIQGISGTPGKDGEDGEDGITPKLKIDANDIWNVSYDNEETWTSLGVSATGPKGETGAQGPQGISGTPGKNGENGITPHIGENNHWFIGDVDTNISATGPQGPAGTNGTNGKDGTDGKDGVSPTVTTATIEGGNRVTFTYGEGSTEYIDVMSGIPGLPGVSPTVTVTNIPADPSDPDHKNGGTEITITDATSTNKFSAWNGNDGTMAGAPDIEGKNGISAILAGSTYEVGLSGEFYTAITSISSKLDESDFTTYTATTAPDAFQAKGNYLSANALNGYATESWVGDQGYLKQNDIAGKADKTELETVSGEIVDMIPSLNGYATEQYVQGASAEVTAWVSQQNYLTSVPSEYITDTELSTALLGYLTKLSADDLYQPIGNYLTEVATSGSIIGTGLAANKIGLVTSAENALKDVVNKANTTDVYSKTDADDKFVTTANITTQGADYVMTTTGWKVLSLPGGGMTQVIHDTTLTGQGNADDNKLGVAWSALSGNTIASALSAGSASYAVALGTTASYSALSDIAGAINDAKFAGVSITAGSSITGNGLSTNKLGLASSAEDALTAVDNKLDKTAIVTATIDNTNYVTAVNINSSNIPIKDTSFWEVTAATGTTASNNTWQHYISTTNTFNYYKMVIHPNGTSSAQEWANDGIIHIILEA